jgi:hypothetical protein
VKWFDAQTADDKRTIALAAIERLMNEGKISFWADDLVDKWGDEIPDKPSVMLFFAGKMKCLLTTIEMRSVQRTTAKRHSNRTGRMCQGGLDT